jgi:hypothetical protein
MFDNTLHAVPPNVTIFAFAGLGACKTNDAAAVRWSHVAFVIFCFGCSKNTVILAAVQKLHIAHFAKRCGTFQTVFLL